MNTSSISHAIHQLFDYYHLSNDHQKTYQNYCSIEEILEQKLNGTGIFYRSITLSPDWSNYVFTPLIVFLPDEQKYVFLSPDKFGNLYYLDPNCQKKCYVTKSNEDNIACNAYMFYQSFPETKITKKELMRFALKSITSLDKIQLTCIAFLIALCTFFIPLFVHFMMSSVLHNLDLSLFIATAIFTLTIFLSKTFFEYIFKQIVKKKSLKISMNMSAATFLRLLFLPRSNWKLYPSIHFGQYVLQIHDFVRELLESSIATIILSCISIILVLQILRYEPILFFPSSIMCIAIWFFVRTQSRLLQKNNKEELNYISVCYEQSYSIIRGIDRIRISGAEDRFFNLWKQNYLEMLNQRYNRPFFEKYGKIIIFIIEYLGLGCAYYIASKSNVLPSTFFVYLTSLGIIIPTIQNLAGALVKLDELRPRIDFLVSVCSIPIESEKKQLVTKLNGNIEFQNVSFRYSTHGPNIINDFSFSVSSGESLAIVGKSGCGKSTIISLLLGFEQPQQGTITYDAKNINDLNLRTLRKKIGVVLQDGKLIHGSILDNIVVSDPNLTEEDAFKAAEIAGIAEEIKRLPMGMQTIVSEESETISAGQKQRILIARAIIKNPSVIILDEATSALDNNLQKEITDRIDNMVSTRIIIAHRLSTIKNAQRIILLDAGNIVEEGSYEELINKKGEFYRFVQSQQL